MDIIFNIIMVIRIMLSELGAAFASARVRADLSVCNLGPVKQKGDTSRKVKTLVPPSVTRRYREDKNLRT